MNGVEIRPADGAAIAGQASSILNAAWPLPRLHYTPEYLAWQLSFPGPAGAPGVAAFSGGRAVGFAAATPRRVRFRGVPRDVLLVSFVAVLPEAQGQGLAAALYAELLSIIRVHRIAVVTFALSGSAGERAIRRAYPAAGYHLHAAGSYPVYGTVSRACGSSEWAVEDAIAVLEQAFAAAADESLLCSAPSAELLRHYRHDPRGRTFLVCREGARVLGAASLVRVEHVTRRGIEAAPVVESVWFSRSRPDLLSSMAAAAAELWPGATVIQAPSLCGFDAAALRQAGFRQIAPSFQGYVATLAPDDPLGAAAGSDLEVV